MSPAAWATLLVLPMLWSCAASTQDVWRPAVYPTTTLNAGTVEVTLSDDRDVVGNRDLRVPAMTFPWQGATKQLALPDGFGAALNEKAQRLLGRGSAELLFDTRVVLGVASWDSSMRGEQAVAEVEVEVRCFSVRRRAWLASSSGHASGYVRAIDIAADEPVALFDRAVLRAFEEAITRPLFVRLINVGLCARREGPCERVPPPDNATARGSTAAIRRGPR